MAKEHVNKDQIVDQFALAEKLYVQFWQPKGQTQEDALAALAFQGAQAFGRVAARIHEGQKPQDIIGQ